MVDIYAKLVELSERNAIAALCVLTSTTGSVPRKAGAKMIVTSSGEIFGTIGGGKVEQQVKKRATEMMTGTKPEVLRINLEDDAEMQCGGAVEVYIEPLQSVSRLFIFGAGHVGSALARLARNFSFEVTVIDDRKDLLKEIEANHIKVLEGAYDKIADELFTDEHTYMVVTTPKHDSDIGTTGILARKNCKYLGMIGSAKKVKKAKQTFAEMHIDEALISKIDMPIGIPFNAQTPDEIAISILAKIIDVRNN